MLVCTVLSFGVACESTGQTARKERRVFYGFGVDYFGFYNTEVSQMFSTCYDSLNFKCKSVTYIADLFFLIM